MDRRQFLKRAAALSMLSVSDAQGRRTSGQAAAQSVHRVRPGDPSWPVEASWDRLRREVHGRLIKVEAPLVACAAAPEGTSCREVLQALKNPYYIGAQPALTQTSGWVDAWMSVPSIYAVVAAETADVMAAVNFAREHHLRLVVKGGAHSYQGASWSADSLLIWTRAMNHIVLHDAFVPQDCTGTLVPQPAVTVGAGSIWMHVYDAVTTQGGRYVQGGSCTTAREVEAASDTAMNPVVLDAFALAIITGNSPLTFPSLPGHEANLITARRHARAINAVMDALLQVVPHPGSYVSESDFFERAWQHSFWGSNYPRLAAVKTKYDPSGLFFVHHGVGSEAWSADGFTKLAEN